MGCDLAAVQRERLGHRGPASAQVVAARVGRVAALRSSTPPGQCVLWWSQGRAPVGCSCLLRRVWVLLCRVTYEATQMQTAVKANAGGDVAFDETLSFSKDKDRHIIKARLRPATPASNNYACACASWPHLG